jgi:ABC-type sugar transport system permease subunit
MSMSPPAAPHRVSIADIDIPFWRIVAILIKWAIAAIPATIVLSIIFAIVAAAIGLLAGGLMGNLHDMMGKWI